MESQAAIQPQGVKPSTSSTTWKTSSPEAPPVARKPRILLGWTEIAGYYSALQAGLLAHGIHAIQVDCSVHPFAYRRSERRPDLLSLFEHSMRHWRRGSLLRRLLLTPWIAMLAVLVMAHVVLSFDAIILAGGRPLSGCFLELWLLRVCRKRVISVFHGTDSRPSWCSGWHLSVLEAGPDALAQAARRAQRRVHVAEAFSMAVVQLPQTDHFHRRRYLSHLELGVPSCGEDVPRPPNAAEPIRREGKIVALHCPSQPKLKGSAQIVEAVEAVRHEVPDLGLQQIIGRPNTEVQDALRSCDFVIDQCWADTPLAGFATEAAWAGRTVIVGGYSQEWLRPDAQLSGSPLPVRYAQPERLIEAILQVATDREDREHRGAAAYRFVSSRWTRRQIAGRFLRVLRARADDCWWRKPGAQPHPLGCGADRRQVARAIRLLVRRHGASGLGSQRRDVLRACLEVLRAGTDRAG